MLRLPGPGLAALLLAATLGCAPITAEELGLGPPPPEPAPPLPPEAGFLDIPPQPGGAAYPARMFFSFQPAERDPGTAPLLVIWNGGPGSPTSSHLMAYGTGPFTVSVEMDPGDAPIENPARLSRFAHLLYLEARQAGLSYGLGGIEQCDGFEDALLDAGDFTLALLSFLDARPALRDRRVVFLGESYGGARAAAAVYMLQHHAAPLDPAAGFPDLARLPWLRERVQAHFDLTDPDRAGEERTPWDVAGQFGWQALIQPGFAGDVQREFSQSYIASDPLLSGYPHTYDGELDVRVPPEEEQRRNEIGERAVLTPEHLSALVGVAAQEIDGLGPEARAGAFRTSWPDPAPADEGELRALLGELGPGDGYWSRRARVCNAYTGDTTALVAFLEVTSRTRAFITRARYDTRVYTGSLPDFFAQLVPTLDVATDEAPRPGVARPGWIRIAYPAGEQAEIRFPAYDSGHPVATTHASELAEDLEAWLREEGALDE